MRDRGLEYKVGLLILASTGILVSFLFILGNYSLRSGFTIYLDYNYVGSLQAGAPVKLSGIKVGKVRAVELYGGRQDPAIGKRVQVRVTAWVEDRVGDSIRSDAEYFINTAGVLGEQYLEIVPGTDWARPPIRPDTIVHDEHYVHDPPRTDLVVARLYEVLDGVSGVLRDDRDQIKHLLANGASAVAEANQLLTDNRAQIGELIGGATAFARQATTTLDKVNAGLGDGKPVASLIASADATLVTARSSLQTLTPPASSFLTDATRVTGLVTEQRLGAVDRALDSATTAAGRAGTLLDNANGVVTDLRAGKGTAGALLSRDELYSDLREMIRDLKRNPWKFFWKE
ncbi:MAG: MCE family protein [Deltaproteobacteria bacterium]|nr:MAG: MCE family protein [Deltaproteobacteria bacterium]TMQ14355.1 MAG: MCE family protein [Deltaproteobacteria bacterium]